MIQRILILRRFWCLVWSSYVQYKQNHLRTTTLFLVDSYIIVICFIFRSVKHSADLMISTGHRGEGVSGLSRGTTEKARSFTSVQNQHLFLSQTQLQQGSAGRRTHRGVLYDHNRSTGTMTSAQLPAPYTHKHGTRNRSNAHSNQEFRLAWADVRLG